MLTIIILIAILIIITSADTIITYRCFEHDIYPPSFLSTAFLDRGLGFYVIYRFLGLCALLLAFIACYLHPYFLHPRTYLIIVDLVIFVSLVVKDILYYLPYHTPISRR